MLRRLVAAARRLAGLVQAAFHQLDVAEHELGLHEVDVRARVERGADVRDLGVLEDADHVRHGVHPADVGEEPVAEALAAARALGQPGDVHHVDGRVDLLGRLEHLVQQVEPRIRHGHDAEVGLGRGERIRGRGGLRVGERVEQCGLADVGQTDDAELHGRLPSLLVSRVSRRRDMSRSWSRTLPGYLESTYATVSRGVCQMGGPEAVSADVPPLARLPRHGAEDRRGDVRVGEGNVIGRRRDRAGRPARRLRARHQRDLERVGGAERVLAQPGGSAEAAGDGELVAAGRRVEIDHADGRAPLHVAHGAQEVPGAELAVLLGAERDEDDGVRRRHLLDAAGDLEQQADAGGVVQVALAHRHGVVVGADDELFGGVPILDGDDVGRMDTAPARGRDELVGAREVAVLLERAGDELARVDLAPGVGGALADAARQDLGRGVGDAAVRRRGHGGGRPPDLGGGAGAAVERAGGGEADDEDEDGGRYDGQLAATCAQGAHVTPAPGRGAPRRRPRRVRRRGRP